MRKGLDFFFGTITKLNILNEIIAEISSIILAIIVVWGVLLTYVFKKSDVFSVEISEYLLIIICFTSIAYVLKEEKHVSVDMFVEKMSLTKRKILDIFTSFLCMAFCSIASWKAFTIMNLNYQRHFYSTSSIRFPIWIPYFIIFYGFLTLSLQFLVKIYNLIIGFADKTNHFQKSVEGEI